MEKIIDKKSTALCKFSALKKIHANAVRVNVDNIARPSLMEGKYLPSATIFKLLLFEFVIIKGKK